MEKDYPQKLYGYWDGDSDEFGEDQFLITNADPSQIVQIGETKRVAIYEFKGYADIQNETKTTAVEV